MQTISSEDIIRRIRTENPWWGEENAISQSYRDMRSRAYFDIFFPLVKATSIRRAVVLMGPRRVGKTVMIHHTVQRLITERVSPKSIVYFAVDNPVYNGLSLEKLLERYSHATGMDFRSDAVYAFFDEIQYLPNWETHLKSLVDSYPNLKATVSGSAAAALRLASNESGAGRFTDFLLPPLTFYEYLDIVGKTDLVGPSAGGGTFPPANDIEELNKAFIFYLNFGGYPEVIFSDAIRSDPVRFIKNDIIDKVLLRDLPSLYGIEDIPELNSLFTTLAFNTANEVSLSELSVNSGVAKNTIKRYIEYLEAAFLIKMIHRVDQNGRRFKRANFFKVYLTNPSMRAALFSPVDANDQATGNLAETAIYSQWFHSTLRVPYYARWDRGEVDIVSLDLRTQKALWAVEVKWSDRACVDLSELSGSFSFARANGLTEFTATSKTQALECLGPNGIKVQFVPTSIYCYTVGHNLIRGRKAMEELGYRFGDNVVIAPENQSPER